MKRFIVLVGILVLAFVARTMGEEPTVAEVTHSELQAVDEYGQGTYNPYDDTDKVIVEGIIINNPEEMLDPTPGAPAYIGGQWQMFVQADDPCDHSGTAVWLGQYYSRVGGSGDYNDLELLEEMCRINKDPNTGYIFTAGDKVRVTGWYKFYGGKTNINEKHQDTNDFDFEIELIKPAYGLPQPEVITLDQVKDANDIYIFDQTRQTGCEYYQARLVRIENVNVIDPENWGPDNTITITDSNGLTFPVELGIGSGFSRFDCPIGQIDIIGIFDQEAPGCSICDYGYRIWVTNYDGNGLVLTDRGYKRGNLPGDINNDFKVDFKDFAEMATNWLKCAPGLCGCN